MARREILEAVMMVGPNGSYIPVASAIVEVRVKGTTTPATTYTTETSSAGGNPATTDLLGRINLWIDDTADVDLYVTKAGAINPVTERLPYGGGGGTPGPPGPSGSASIQVGLLASRPASASDKSMYLATDDKPAATMYWYDLTAAVWKKMPNATVFCANDAQWGESSDGANDGGAVGAGIYSTDLDHRAIQHCLNAAANMANARTLGAAGTAGPADPAGTETNPIDSPNWFGAIIWLKNGIYYLQDYSGEVAATWPKAGYLHQLSNTMLIGSGWATIIRHMPTGKALAVQTPAHQGGTTVRFTFTGSIPTGWAGTLTSAIGSGDVMTGAGVVAVSATESFILGHSTAFWIDGERFTYTGRSTTSGPGNITGVTRATSGTTAAAHSIGAPACIWVDQFRASTQHVRNNMNPPNTRFAGLQKEPGYNVFGAKLKRLGTNFIDIEDSSFTSSNVTQYAGITNSTGRIGLSPGFQGIRTLLGSSNIGIGNLTLDGNDLNRCATGEGIVLGGSDEGTPESEIIKNERVRIYNVRIINWLGAQMYLHRTEDAVVEDVYGYGRRGGTQAWTEPKDVEFRRCLVEGGTDDSFAFLATSWAPPPNGFGTIGASMPNNGTTIASLPVTQYLTFGTNSDAGRGQIGQEKVAWTGKSGSNLLNVARAQEGTSFAAHSSGDTITTHDNKPGLRNKLIDCIVGPCGWSHVDGQAGGTVDITGQHDLQIRGLVILQGDGLIFRNNYGVENKNISVSDFLIREAGRSDQNAEAYYQFDRAANAIDVIGASFNTSQTAGKGEDPAAGASTIKFSNGLIVNPRGSGMSFYVSHNNYGGIGAGGSASIKDVDIDNVHCIWDNPLPSWVYKEGLLGVNDFRYGRGMRFEITATNTNDKITDVGIFNSRILNSPHTGIYIDPSGAGTPPLSPERFQDFKIMFTDVLDSGTVRTTTGNGTATAYGIHAIDVRNLQIVHSDLRDRKTTKTMADCLALSHPDGRVLIESNNMSEYLTAPFAKIAGFPMPSGSHLYIRNNIGWDPWRGVIQSNWNAAVTDGAGSHRSSGGGGGSLEPFDPEFPTGVVPRVQLTPQNHVGMGPAAVNAALNGSPINTGFRVLLYSLLSAANFDAQGTPIVAWAAEEYE